MLLFPTIAIQATGLRLLVQKLLIQSSNASAATKA